MCHQLGQQCCTVMQNIRLGPVAVKHGGEAGYKIMEWPHGASP
jgi:hypothetical protein